MTSLNFNKISNKLFEISGTPTDGDRKAQNDTARRIFQTVSWDASSLPRVRKKTRETSPWREIFFIRFVFSTQDIQDLSFLIEKRDSHALSERETREHRIASAERRKSAEGRGGWMSGGKKREQGRNKTPINRSYRCNKRRYKNWAGKIGFSRNDDYHARYAGIVFTIATAFQAKNAERK